MKEKQLTDLIRPAVAALGYELLGCEYLAQGKHSVLRVYIDHVNGIDLDDCARASEQVSAVLDVEEAPASAYSLEVSSPGLERPLFDLPHFEQVIGKTIKVRMHSRLHGRRNFRGILQQATSAGLVVMVNEQAFELPLAAIEKANLVVDTW